MNAKSGPSDSTEWEHGKEQHRRLSAATAERYDELYEKANFATGSYMKYEIRRLNFAVSQVPDREIAVDLGCGTGRASFELAKKFTVVYGYDFAPEMVEVANKKKTQRSAGNISFRVADIEMGLTGLGLQGESADLVNSAFGMGSFVERIEDLTKTVRWLLKPAGIGVFSFYNRKALVNELDLDWQPALAARPVPNKRLLRVQFEGEDYEIPAVTYSTEEVQSKLASNFDVVEITTFPNLTALFPQSLFKSERARDLCSVVDDLLAGNEGLHIGPYIIAIVRKRGKAPKPPAFIGYGRVLHLLKLHKIDAQQRTISHHPVRNIAEVRDQFPNVAPRNMVKAILVSSPARNPRRRSLSLMAIPADKRLDFGKVARLLNVRRPDVRMATALEMEERTGFSVGSVPPFAMPEDIPVFFDKSLGELNEIWCGTGKSTETLRLSVEEFSLLSTPTYADLVL